VAEIPHQPSREEREFWDDQFRDRDRRPRRSPESHPASRREQRFARVPDGPLTRLVDRVRDWRTDARFGVIVLVVIAVVAGVVWYRIGVGGASAGEPASTPRAVTTTAASVAAAVGGDPTTPTTAPGASTKIAVHVAGAVTHPGVVELRAGARVIDAVEAVGGALTDGDLDRLNLAAKVADGQRIYVAKVGQADPGVAGDATGGGVDAGSGPGVPNSGVKVNLNTASQAQLEELPGIGPTYAQSIIAERQRRGGFKSVNDLRSVRGIGDKRFAELAPLVTV
jgi:competence protein ComEA